MKEYSLNIRIDLKRAALPDTGRALGVLFRRHLHHGLAGCSVDRQSDTEVARKAEAVAKCIFDRPSARERIAGPTPPETREILLNDEEVGRLSRYWGKKEIPDCTIVVPHMFYLTLVQSFIRNLEKRSLKTLKQACFVFDYSALQDISEIVRKSFWGERASVLRFLRSKGLRCIDPGLRLNLENVISLACYIFPAKYLVFMDDDFFLKNGASLDVLLEPLRSGYQMSGSYVLSTDRIHTSFFAMKPDCLRDKLDLFDDGVNLYMEDLRDTGTITFRTLAAREKGVFITGDYVDRNGSFGWHLGHCTMELWSDLPQILNLHFNKENLSGAGRMRLDASILLEALATYLGVQPRLCGHKPVGTALRINGLTDFVPYFQRIYDNHHWLLRQSGSENPTCDDSAGDPGART